MEFKTCEERVLAELDAAEKKNEELSEELEKISKLFLHQQKMLGLAKQIFSLTENPDGSYEIKLKSLKVLHPAENESDREAVIYLKALIGGLDDAEEKKSPAPKKKNTPAPENKKN